MRGCLIALLAAICLPLLAVFLYLRQGGCTTLVQNQAISPDGSWRAMSALVWCESPVQTAVSHEVTLQSIRPPGIAVNVLTIDGAGNDQQRAKVTWVSPTVLRVSVPNISLLTVSRRQYQGIWIDLRFEPDDRNARDQWLKAMGRQASLLER